MANYEREQIDTGDENVGMEVPIIDLSKAQGREEEAEIIINFVKSTKIYQEGLRQGKFQQGLLYRGFNGENIPKVLATGNDKTRPFISACSEENLPISGDASRESALDYLGNRYQEDYPILGLSVYDAALLHEDL